MDFGDLKIMLKYVEDTFKEDEWIFEGIDINDDCVDIGLEKKGDSDIYELSLYFTGEVILYVYDVEDDSLLYEEELTCWDYEE